MNYILILFAVFNGGSSSEVRVGFTSQSACETAAKQVEAKLMKDFPSAKVSWVCAKQ